MDSSYWVIRMQRVAKNKEGKESMMGKHSCSVINNKGSKIVDVCQEKKFIIEGTGPFTDQYKIHRMVTRRVKLTEH